MASKQPKNDKGNDASSGAMNNRLSSVADRETIARRAYELYLARGGRDGRDVEDWLHAERELTGHAERSGEDHDS